MNQRLDEQIEPREAILRLFTLSGIRFQIQMYPNQFGVGVNIPGRLRGTFDL